MSKSATGSAALVMASRLVLPERANGSLLIATMEAGPVSPVRDHNQDDATGFIRLNPCVPPSGIAAKVQKERR